MTYALLLWPHANQRYEEAAQEPAAAELDIILSSVSVQTLCKYREIKGVGALVFEAETLAPHQLHSVCRHSLLYWFGILEDENTFKPMFASPQAYLGDDLAFIQKYKGKTNERFTQQLINMALYSCRFADCDTQIQLLDPMCGRGTTLFQAANREWDVFGIDADKKDVHECASFFEKYLKYHKLKHKRTQSSKTLKDQPAVMVQKFQYGGEKGNEHTLMVGAGDCKNALQIYGREAVHLVVCDLPYGVQHAPNGKGGADSFERMLKECLPVWKQTLKKGGAVALSYNTHTLKTESVRNLMEEAGFSVLRGGGYDRMTHWVEQAVVRDIAVCIKK